MSETESASERQRINRALSLLDPLVRGVVDALDQGNKGSLGLVLVELCKIRAALTDTLSVKEGE